MLLCVTRFWIRHNFVNYGYKKMNDENSNFTFSKN